MEETMRVTLKHYEVQRFKRQFPSSRIPDLDSITFEFQGGNLVDIEATIEGQPIDSSQFAGDGLHALSEDAKLRGPYHA
jgi:hypothetical protein